MAEPRKPKSLIGSRPEDASGWASAAALALSLVDAHAVELSAVFDDYLAPTEDGEVVVPAERQAEFHRALAARLTVAASRGRSIGRILEIAEAFRRLSENEVASQALLEDVVRIVASHSSKLQARQRFIEAPAVGTA